MDLPSDKLTVKGPGLNPEFSGAAEDLSKFSVPFAKETSSYMWATLGPILCLILWPGTAAAVSAAVGVLDLNMHRVVDRLLAVTLVWTFICWHSTSRHSSFFKRC